VRFFQKDQNIAYAGLDECVQYRWQKKNLEVILDEDITGETYVGPPYVIL
jgi:hypothetical protein